MFLNGSHFPTYGLDTQETRMARIAFLMNTHPKFLIVEPKELIPLEEKTNILRDVLREIREGAQNMEVLVYITSHSRSTLLILCDIVRVVNKSPQS